MSAYCQADHVFFYVKALRGRRLKWPLVKSLYGSVQMAEILVRCPVTGHAIFTGLNTDTVVFETLPNIEMPLKCSRCGKTHYWKPKSAWLALPSDLTRH